MNSVAVEFEPVIGLEIHARLLTETKIFCTVNARAARNFIEQRASRFAEPEIRKLACKLHQLLVREAPNASPISGLSMSCKDIPGWLRTEVSRK